MTDKRFIIDDAGTLIDLDNRNIYDYVSDVCELLNELADENEELKQQLTDCEKFRHTVFQQINQEMMKQ